ncbi:dTMP kinase [Candidatus Parvarchaeota archaeon]|jgi:dTMP kinase|nr:dTMP kinase [Candidatus Acidifodinimicrobium mancum]
MAGKLIVFEGLDGAGLRTQATLLEVYLKEKKYRTLLTSEPTNGLIGGLIRSRLQGEIKLSNRTLQLLFSADRAQHVEEVIQPAINSNKIVICDRYIFSTLAYGYASKLNYRWLRQLNLSFRLPDLGILLDVKPSVSLGRISSSVSSFEIFNKEKELSDVRKAFMMIASNFHLKVIDGNGSVEETRSKIIKIVDRFLEKGR